MPALVAAHAVIMYWIDQYMQVPGEISNSNPHMLLTEEVIQDTIKKDLGQHWELQDFKIKDFTKKGDNYMCAVTSVSCTATCNGKRKETFYVAKLNPLRQITALDNTLNDVFIREGVFFTDVAIKLNDILQNIKYQKINFPECVYSNFNKGKEIILTRDLRQKGYKMFDKRVGMDISHSELLVKSLAKLHASSHIFKSRLQNKGVLDIYPFLKDNQMEIDNEGRELFESLMKSSIGSSIKLLQNVKGYDRQYEWLKDLQDNVGDVYADLINNCPENMRVICHGDCWNNNVVFRYDDRGCPQEITLLDLQICRFASLGLDLNHFFYTSLTGDTRQRYRKHFLSVYFNEFSNVIKSANMEMPFSEEDFREEVNDKVLFGIISGLIATPHMICESKDAMDLNDVKDGVEEFMDCQNERLARMMKSNPIFKERFLSTVDDILEEGVMDR